MTAKKFDKGKPRISLLPLDILKGVSDVAGFGAKKYNDHNWRKGMDWTKLLDSCQRHIIEWSIGNDLDEESNLNHLDHAIINLMYLRWYIKNNKGNDDRFKEQ